jgi:opacity protein-like surface antigen
MFTAYYDLGHRGVWFPYVGAGVCLARKDVDNIAFSTPNGQFGDDKWSLPGSLMAGADFQIREREIVDLSDRYIDLAQAGSGHRRYERLHINPPFVGRRSDRA